MGFIDATCYGFPESLDCLKLCFPRLAGWPRPPQRGQPRDWLPPSASQWVTATLPEETTSNIARGIVQLFHRTLAPFTAAAKGINRRPYRFFLTTFDQNYQSLPPSNLFRLIRQNELADGIESWIPVAGYHIYVVGLQKSRDTAKLRQAIHAHLGGPSKYHMVATAELSESTYICKTALILFVRTVDVESGAFRLIGVNKVPIRASRTGCKGLVGLSFRMYDQAIAIINCYLPGLGQYQEDEDYRNKHVAAMLRDLRIDAEHELWDTHLQYHHVFLMGNMGTRTLNMSPQEVLTKITESAKTCQEKMESVRLRGMEWSWRGAGYNRFWSTGLEKSNDAQERPMACSEGQELKEGWEESDVETGLSGTVEDSLTHVAARAWSWVKDHDSLRREIEDGMLFSGFKEAEITFPPTYKWHPGACADDFTVLSVVESAYKTGSRGGGGGSGGDVNADDEVVPCYMDRILFRSLPDMAHRLAPLAYDCLDRGPFSSLSGHLPVSLAVTVSVDTAQPPECFPVPRAGESGVDLGAEEVIPVVRFGARPGHQREVEQSAIASAMATASISRGPSSWSSLPSGIQPLTKPKFPPLLITISMSNFRFRFAGFKNLEGYGQRRRTGGVDARGIGTAGSDGEETKQQQEGKRVEGRARRYALLGHLSTPVCG